MWDIDIAVPGDQRVAQNEQEKIDNHSDLRQSKEDLEPVTSCGCSSFN